MSRFLILRTALAVAICAFSTTSLADDSFRTASGKLIERGMTDAEVFELLGPPANRPRTAGDSDIGLVDLGGQSVKTWTYELTGSIGSRYIVEITFKGGDVREVESEPLG